MAFRFIMDTRAFTQSLRRKQQTIDKATARAMYMEGEKIMTNAKGLIVSEGIDDTGTLKNSGFVEFPKRNGDIVSVVVGFGGPASPYALFVHEGTLPRVRTGKRWPPVQPLIDWARRKLGLGPEEAEDAGFRIQRKIAYKGTQPTKYLERPANDAIPGLSERVARTISRALNRGTP